MPDQHLRLSELTSQINRAITDRFAGNSYWVIADVTSHTYIATKRNHFFELVEKDPASGNLLAKIQGKAWGAGSEAIVHFERATGQRFGNGISVLIAVEVQFHAQYGLQLNLVQIDVNFTLGALEQQRRQTLERLVLNNPGMIWKVGEKYFTRNNQLAFPLVLQRIAVVASRTSAGAEDLRQTLSGNTHGYTFKIDEYHTPVQGDQFAGEMIKQLIAIYNSGKTYDVVVITRGGGAQTDFLIFDNYDLCRAIARFPVPVITGIGHFRNESIADWMAHTSVKTPTKAAESIIAHNRSFEENIVRHQQTIIIHSQQQFAKRAQELSQAYSKIITHTNRSLTTKKDAMTRVRQIVTSQSMNIIFNRRKSLVDATTSLLSRPRTIIGNQQNNLHNITGNLKTFNAQYLRNQRGYVNHYDSLIKLVSPLNLLKKGFAIVKTNDDKIYTGRNNLRSGEKLKIILSGEQLLTTLNQQIKKDAIDLDL